MILTIPQGYRLIEEKLNGAAYRRVSDGMTVIVSQTVESDGKKWKHVSFAFADHLPSYSDLLEVKQGFLGDHRYAAMVFPPKQLHVNQHPYVLHLFSCVRAEWPMPEFTRGFSTL